MNAINRQNNNSIPADLQPYYDEQPNGPRTWARWLTRILAVIIVACLIFVFVRWVWHQTHKDEPAKTGTTTSQKAEKSDSSTASDQAKDLGGTTEGGDTSSAPSTSTTSTPSTSSTSTANTSNGSTAGSTGSASSTVGQSASTSSTTLANTGPGQTLAIFVASSLCFAFLYELRLRKQTN